MTVQRHRVQEWEQERGCETLGLRNEGNTADTLSQPVLRPGRQSM